MTTAMREPHPVRQVLLVSAWTALAGLVLLAPYQALTDADPVDRRVVLIGLVACLLTTGVTAVRVALTVGPRVGAWLCLAGSAGTLASLAYLWSLRDEPSAIPIGGFAGLFLSLCLLAGGALHCHARL